MASAVPTLWEVLTSNESPLFSRPRSQLTLPDARTLFQHLRILENAILTPIFSHIPSLHHRAQRLRDRVVKLPNSILLSSPGTLTITAAERSQRIQAARTEIDIIVREAFDGGREVSESCRREYLAR